MEEVSRVQATHELEISKIQKGPRQRADLGDIQGMMLSIERKGLLYPVIVEPRTDGTYSLIAGERRLIACESLGWKKIPAIYRTDLKDEIDRKELELEENIMRKDLSLMERANALSELDKLKRDKYGSALPGRFSRGGWTQADTAKSVGLSPATVGQDITIAELSKDHPEITQVSCRKEALRIVRKIQDGSFKKFEESELRIKYKESLALSSAMTCMQGMESNSVDLCFLDLNGLTIGNHIEAMARVVKANKAAYIFYDLEDHLIVVEALKKFDFHVGKKPCIWHMIGRDDYMSYVWAGHGEAEEPDALKYHYSVKPESKIIHTRSKPYGLYHNLVFISSKQGEVILEPTSYSLAVVQVCIDHTRIVKAACASKSIWDACLSGL